MGDNLRTHEAGTSRSSSYFWTTTQHTTTRRTRYEHSANFATTSTHLSSSNRTIEPVTNSSIQQRSINYLPTRSSNSNPENQHRVQSQNTGFRSNVTTLPAIAPATKTSIEKYSNQIPNYLRKPSSFSDFPKSTSNVDKRRLSSKSIFETEFGSNMTTPPGNYKEIIPKQTVSQLNNEERYELTKPGYVLIFNQEKFLDKRFFRKGTMKDEKDLMNFFKKFNVEKFIPNRDLSLDEIESKIDKVRKKDFRKYSCLIVTIMTHGWQNDVLLAKDKDYNFKDTILEPLLQNTTLSGKPKIFIIQACRGDKESENYKLEVDAVPFRSAKAATTTPEADVFKCCSTFEGRVSYRHKEEGTPFIQNFIQVSDKNSKTKPINDIMAEITRNLAKDNPNAQTPVSTSTLTRKFYFGDLLKNE